LHVKVPEKRRVQKKPTTQKVSSGTAKKRGRSWKKGEGGTKTSPKAQRVKEGRDGGGENEQRGDLVIGVGLQSTLKDQKNVMKKNEGHKGTFWT